MGQRGQEGCHDDHLYYPHPFSLFLKGHAEFKEENHVMESALLP